MTASDIRYGRQGGRLVKPAPPPKAPAPVPPPTMAEARAVLAILGAFPGTRVLVTTPGMADLCRQLAVMEGGG